LLHVETKSLLGSRRIVKNFSRLWGITLLKHEPPADKDFVTCSDKTIYSEVGLLSRTF
jgi:hypothetical protein